MDSANNVVETRRFTLARHDCCVASLYRAMACPGAVLSYQDREGDWISLHTELDFEEMTRVVSFDSSNTYRLRCRIVSSSPSLSSVAAKVGGAARRAAEEMAVLGVRATSYVEHKLNEIKQDEEEEGKKKEEEEEEQKETKEGFVVCGEKKEVVMVDDHQPDYAAPPPPVSIVAPVPQQVVVQPSSSSLSSRLAEAARSVAEEALVLTVRAGSYVEHQWNSHNSRHLDEDNDDDDDVEDVDSNVVIEKESESSNASSSSAPSNDVVEERKSRREPIHVELNPSPSPSPSPVPVELEARVSDLVAMGFHDVDVNRAALLRHNLVLENAVADILGEP